MVSKVTHRDGVTSLLGEGLLGLGLAGRGGGVGLAFDGVG